MTVGPTSHIVTFLLHFNPECIVLVIVHRLGKHKSVFKTHSHGSFADNKGERGASRLRPPRSAIWPGMYTSKYVDSMEAFKVSSAFIIP